MSSGSQLRTRYDRLKARLATARGTTERAKSQYEQARAHEASIVAELQEVRSSLDAALEALSAQDRSSPSAPVPQDKSPVRVPAFLRELVAAFPASGVSSLDGLRDGLGLPMSTLNTRIQKARKLGLLVRSGRAEYALTDLGKDTREARPKAVGD